MLLKGSCTYLFYCGQRKYMLLSQNRRLRGRENYTSGRMGHTHTSFRRVMGFLPPKSRLDAIRVANEYSNIRIFEYFLSLNKYSLFKYLFVEIHSINIPYKFMVGTSKCLKLKQNLLKIGCNINQNSLRWGLTWVWCYPG